MNAAPWPSPPKFVSGPGPDTPIVSGAARPPVSASDTLIAGSGESLAAASCTATDPATYDYPAMAVTLGIHDVGAVTVHADEYGSSKWVELADPNSAVKVTLFYTDVQDVLDLCDHIRLAVTS